ncbi:MAG: hypothetical protein WCE87_00835 [Candidatus Udaeobacter sp.]
MRIDDFDSEWHFVPDRPEAIRRFRRTNRAMILVCLIFVLGLFLAMTVSHPVRNSISTTQFSPTPPVHKTKALAPQAR